MGNLLVDSTLQGLLLVNRPLHLGISQQVHIQHSSLIVFLLNEVGFFW